MAGIDRRRPTWLGWIPAIALSIIIIAVLATTATLMAGGLGQEPGEPTANEATERGASLFTDDGLRYIDETREIKLDLRNAPVEAEALGLPEEGSLTVGPHPGSVGTTISYTVMLRTPEGEGLTELEVPEATIITVDGNVSEVRSPVVQAPFRTALDSVKQRADEFGYAVDTASIQAGMGDAVRAGEPYEFTVGPGVALGATTHVEVTCEEPTSCTAVFKITPGVR